MRVRYWKRHNDMPAALGIKFKRNHLVIEFGKAPWYPFDSRTVHLFGGRLTLWWYQPSPLSQGKSSGASDG